MAHGSQDRSRLALRIAMTLALYAPHLGLLQAQSVPKIGDLSVTPTAVLFDGRTRTQEIWLRNTGKDSALYRLSLLHLRMTEQGSLEEVPTFPASAAAMLRFSPRQITIGPGESQLVRVQLRRPENLPDGDYHVHLLFRAVPPEEEVTKPATEELKSVQVQFIAIPGVSIPIIVRQGASKLNLVLENAQITGDENRMFQVTLIQNGKFGLRGTLRLLAAKHGSKTETEIASAKVFHYGDLPRQTLQMPIPATDLKQDLKYQAVLQDENNTQVASIEINNTHTKAQHGRVRN